MVSASSSIWSSATGAAWHDGYVVDAPYTEPVTTDLSPAHLSLISVLRGQPPLDRSRTLSWVELGSGNGLHCCAVAAANADVEVWGCDINPAHVERARSLATRAQLDNCTFDLASFAEVATDPSLGPDEVDVIVIHGVYSWISPENQRHIAEFIRRRLRPGGLVHVGYEVSTGWAAMVPIAEALRLAASASGRRSDLAFPAAAAALHELAEQGAASFPLPPFEAGQFAGLRECDPSYGAHEYLSGHFRPLMFDSVAAAMRSAGCTYLGGIEPVDHLAQYSAPPALLHLLGDTEDSVTRGMLRDLIVQRPLRRDVYRRGLATTTVREHERRLHDLVVVGLGRTLDDGDTVWVPVGSVTLDPSFHAPLLDVLAESPLGLRGIMAVHPGTDLGDAAVALALLVQGGYATPVLETAPDPRATASSRRFNQVLADEQADGSDHGILASPIATGAISVDEAGPRRERALRALGVT
jgi:SAM-dependent methyltransferase